MCFFLLSLIGVKNVVVLSTDKAAYPINAMGISKAMMEKVAIAQGRALGTNAQTTICCTRYGNVMASRGSVIPLWVEQMMSGKAITITDPDMTRFMMTLDDAVDLVIYAFMHGENGDLFVQKRRRLLCLSWHSVERDIRADRSEVSGYGGEGDRHASWRETV
mgnify:CR=1 FL=1